MSNLKLTADVAVLIYNAFSENWEILLVKRKWPPYENMWALPGGHMDEGETLSETASRELEEETGVKIPADKLWLHSVLDDPNRDERGRVISTVYYRVWHGAKEQYCVNDGESLDCQFFDINNLPELAFDHKKITDQLREKYNGQV